MEKRNCLQCDKVYTPKVKRQKFCCEKCQIASRYKEYTCKVCGTVFKSKHPNRKYCSNKCSAKVNLKPDLVHGIECNNCGKEFSRTRARIRATKVGQFCTRKCWDEYNSKMKAEKSHKWKSNLIPCKQCGEKVLRQPNETENRKQVFCSHICYSHWLSENNRGKNSPSWRGGLITDRGENWEEVSMFIRQRDHFQCQSCGEKQNGVMLDVHHKIPYRFFNGDWRKANREENLITLCRSCHAKQESHRWREVPEEYKQYM